MGRIFVETMDGTMYPSTTPIEMIINNMREVDESGMVLFANKDKYIYLRKDMIKVIEEEFD